MGYLIKVNFIILICFSIIEIKDCTKKGELKMVKELEKLMKLNETAKLLNVAPQTLWKWVRSGEGPVSIKTPTGMYLFQPSDIEIWLAGLKGGAQQLGEERR